MWGAGVPGTSDSSPSGNPASVLSYGYLGKLLVKLPIFNVSTYFPSLSDSYLCFKF